MCLNLLLSLDNEQHLEQCPGLDLLAIKDIICLDEESTNKQRAEKIGTNY